MQTGVPFGEVGAVKNFLGLGDVEGEADAGLTVPVLQPSSFHPKRPVTGLKCQRREVSGERLWAVVKKISKVNEEAWWPDGRTVARSGDYRGERERERSIALYKVVPSPILEGSP